MRTINSKFLVAVLLFSTFHSNAQGDSTHRSFIEDFSNRTSKFFHYGSAGTKADYKWKMGMQSPIDKRTKVLAFKIDPNDSAGAGRGPEIISNKFSNFGTYSARLKVPQVAAVQPNVGAVVGYFTYYMDSVYGLSEIDFEWLIADPSIIYVGTWTGPADQLKRIGRTINLATGRIYNTIYKEGFNGASTPLTGMQNEPDTIVPIEKYDASTQFYTYGFDWHSDRLRWWILHPKTGEKIVLWDYQGSQVGIPQHQTYYRINFWHTNNWAVETKPSSIERPLHPYVLEVDWMSYDVLKK